MLSRAKQSIGLANPEDLKNAHAWRHPQVLAYDWWTLEHHDRSGRAAKSQRPLIGEVPSNFWVEVATSELLGFSLVVLDPESAYKRTCRLRGVVNRTLHVLSKIFSAPRSMKFGKGGFR